MSIGRSPGVWAGLSGDRLSIADRGIARRGSKAEHVPPRIGPTIRMLAARAAVC